MFPVFPSSQNLGYLSRKKSSNPELVYQLQLKNVSMFLDLLCRRASTATAVTLQHFDSILSNSTKASSLSANKNAVYLYKDSPQNVAIKAHN